MSIIKTEKVLVFPGEENMIVRTRPPYKYLRKLNDQLSIEGTPRDQIKETTKDGIGGGDVQFIPDYSYPDWTQVDCVNLQQEIDALNSWIQVNDEKGLISQSQRSTAFQQLHLANSKLQTCPQKIGDGGGDLQPVDDNQCNNNILLKSVTVTGTPTYIKIDVSHTAATSGFAYEISKSGGGYSKSGNVEGTTVTIAETIPAGTYTANVRAICGSVTSQTPTTQEFTVTAPAGETKDTQIPVIPVIPMVANTASRVGGGGGGGGGGGSSSSKTSSATAVKKTTFLGNYWWLLLLAAAGGTYYLYKKNKKK